MALEATHIKFALDFKDHFTLQNLDEYLSGTIYPDSRYRTGIARTKTHGDFLLDPTFATDDFKKGWMMHYICDRAGNIAMDELFADLQEGLTERGAGTEWWVRATTLKILIDFDVLTYFDVKKYLPISYAKNPYEESIKIIRNYNGFISTMYLNEAVTTENMKDMWAHFGIEEVLLNRVITCKESYQHNVSIMKRVVKIYPRMIEVGLEFLKK